MSSVVKKATRFAPKKALPIRNKSVTPLTPPATQKESAANVEEKDKDKDDDEDDTFEDALSAPSVDFKFSITKSQISQEPAEDVDPMDTSKKVSMSKQVEAKQERNEGDSESDDDSDIDNDIFKKPEDSLSSATKKYRRQSSIHMQRRLSGITPSVIRNRSGSISITPTPKGSVPPEGPDDVSPVMGGADEVLVEYEEEQPVVIGIPTTRPSRKRKPSVSIRRNSVRRNKSFLTPNASMVISKEVSPPIAETGGRKRKYSIGVDPSTQKLTKYRIEHLKDIGDKADNNAIESEEDEEDVEETKVAKSKKFKTGESSKDAAVEDSDAEAAAGAAATLASLAGSLVHAPASQEETRSAGAKVTSSSASSSTSSDTAEELSSDKKEAKKSKKSEIKKLERIPDGKLISSVKFMSQVPRSFKHEDPLEMDEITIEPESMTMSDLCLPTFAIGKPSTRYQQVIEAKKNQAKEKQKRKEIRDAARKERKSIEEITGEDFKKRQKEKKRDIIGELPDEQSQNAQNALLLKLGEDNKLIVDQDSTSVSRGAPNVNADKDREVANPFDNPITSSTYSKRKYTDRWDSEEIIKFYQALSTWGTDFTFIAQLFPYRTRKQIKSKFNLEEKKHPEIIDLALRTKLPADFESYCKESKKEILSLDEYNDQLKDIRVKHEEDMAQIVAQREQAIKEDAEESRKREFAIRTGGQVKMTKQERERELRKNEVIVGDIADVKKKYDEP
ncbi:transcription factor TFIIIB component B'' [[Candida] railenensis]|uniref:Transcription factor TFIIIB component B n=1 Tax=[Candida] railenensis TaxID=45579 RepID=A0A9P0QVA6_9ASCO|nr:transcription factor TFIIIB component B'' [[Candida] railenensis]